VPAPDRDRDWKIAVNADVERERTATDYPREGDATEIPPGRAAVHLGAWPAGVVGPHGGTVAVEELSEPQSIEDELLRDVETAILDAGLYIERTVPLLDLDEEVVTDGGHDPFRGLDALDAPATAALLARRLEADPDWEALADRSAVGLAVLFAVRLDAPLTRGDLIDYGVVAEAEAYDTAQGLVAEGLLVKEFWPGACGGLLNTYYPPSDDRERPVPRTDGGRSPIELLDQCREYVKAGREAEALGTLDRLRNDLTDTDETVVGSYPFDDVEESYRPRRALRGGDRGGPEHADVPEGARVPPPRRRDRGPRGGGSDLRVARRDDHETALAGPLAGVHAGVLPAVPTEVETFTEELSAEDDGGDTDDLQRLLDDEEP